MLHKCANPGGSIRLGLLRRGKLFQFESEYYEAPAPGAVSCSRKARPIRRVERYWLCDECAASLTLTFDQSRGVVTVPLPDAAGQRVLTAVHLEEIKANTVRPPAGHEARWGMRRSTWTS